MRLAVSSLHPHEMKFFFVAQARSAGFVTNLRDRAGRAGTRIAAARTLRRSGRRTHIVLFFVL
jgi:hypothetical protein